MFFKSDKEVNSRGKCFKPEGAHAKASRKERAPYVQDSKRWDHFSYEHRPYICTEKRTHRREHVPSRHTTLTQIRAQSAHTNSEAHVPVWTNACTHTYVNTQSSTQEYTEPCTSGLPW